MSMDGKPVSQMFADELDQLIEKYQGSGLEISQAIGVLHMTMFNLECDVRSEIEKKERPF